MRYAEIESAPQLMGNGGDAHRNFEHVGMSIQDLLNNYKHKMDHKMRRRLRSIGKKGHVWLMGTKAAKEDSKISAVEVKGWREVELTIDSRACGTVMPWGMCPDIKVQEPDN